MDSFLPVFYELLKVFGVKNPSEGMIYFFIIDMLFPFVMAIAFGFLMGAITVFCIMKIAQLEKTNKELLEKIEKKKMCLKRISFIIKEKFLNLQPVRMGLMC